MSKIALLKTKSFQFTFIIALAMGIGFAFAIDTDWVETSIASMAGVGGVAGISNNEQGITNAEGNVIYQSYVSPACVEGDARYVPLATLSSSLFLIRHSIFISPPAPAGTPTSRSRRTASPPPPPSRMVHSKCRSTSNGFRSTLSTTTAKP